MIWEQAFTSIWSRRKGDELGLQAAAVAKSAERWNRQRGVMHADINQCRPRCWTRFALPWRVFSGNASKEVLARSLY